MRPSAPPASTSQVLEFEACATTPGFCRAWAGTQNTRQKLYQLISPAHRQSLFKRKVWNISTSNRTNFLFLCASSLYVCFCVCHCTSGYSAFSACSFEIILHQDFPGLILGSAFTLKIKMQTGKLCKP